MKDCPHAAGQENDTSSGSKVSYSDDSTRDMYITLFQTSIPATTDEVLCLMAETLNMVVIDSMAVIDSMCLRTVCGSKWYVTYLDSMSDEQNTNLQTKKSNALFHFRDSSPKTSKEKGYLPVTIIYIFNPKWLNLMFHYHQYTIPRQSDTILRGNFCSYTYTFHKLT